MEKKFFIYLFVRHFWVFYIVLQSSTLYASSATPSRGGPVLYIKNNTNSKVWVRDIPTQDYGKNVPVIYYTPTNFDPLPPHELGGKHDFYYNQWFGHPGQASGKITLASDDPNDPNRWDSPLKIEVKESGIKDEIFKPNEARDLANKREKTLEIKYSVDWNGNGWKITLDELGKKQ